MLFLLYNIPSFARVKIVRRTFVCVRAAFETEFLITRCHSLITSCNVYCFSTPKIASALSQTKIHVMCSVRRILSLVLSLPKRASFRTQFCLLIFLSAVCKTPCKRDAIRELLYRTWLDTYGANILAPKFVLDVEYLLRYPKVNVQTRCLLLSLGLYDYITALKYFQDVWVLINVLYCTSIMNLTYVTNEKVCFHFSSEVFLYNFFKSDVAMFLSLGRKHRERVVKLAHCKKVSYHMSNFCVSCLVLFPCTYCICVFLNVHFATVLCHLWHSCTTSRVPF